MPHDPARFRDGEARSILIYLDGFSALGDLVGFSAQFAAIRRRQHELGRRPLFHLFVRSPGPVRAIFAPLIESGELVVHARGSRRGGGVLGWLSRQAGSWWSWARLQAVPRDEAIYYVRPRNLLERLRARRPTSHAGFVDYAGRNGLDWDPAEITAFEHVRPHRFGRPTIGLYLAASTTLRSWDPQGWARLAAAVRHRYGGAFGIHLYGFGPSSRSIAASFAKHASRLGLAAGVDYVSFIDAHSLEDDIAHCKGLDLAVTNDSGFMWVGNAVGVRTVSILGGLSPDRYRGFFARNAARWEPIESRLPCSPCSHAAACPRMTRADGLAFQDCMLEDRFALVWQAVERQLAFPAMPLPAEPPGRHPAVPLRRAA